MKKAIVFLLLLAMAVALPCQQGAEALILDGAAYLSAFFKGKYDVRVAIVHFENRSDLNDLALQKIYQLLVSRLEGERNIRLSDLLVHFSDGRGEFNLNQAASLDYLVDMKLIQDKSKTGLGLTVFSRLQDKIVAMKYFERTIGRGEMEFLNTRNFAFSELGFSMLLEFESKRDLMDIRSIADAGGQEQYFFYYPNEVIIYLARETRLEKHFQFKLAWKRPLYPVLHYEGKLLLFRSGSELVLTAGGNFSPTAQALTFRDGQWQEAQKIDFVPLKHVLLNQNPYLVGARYAEGRNFFREKIYFLPFGGPADRGEAFERSSYPAMALDFSTQEGQLQAVHLIDREYKYRLFTAEFEEKSPLPEKKGAALAALDGAWLAVSDHTLGSDQLFFYDIRDGGQKPVYTTRISGEVRFISAGTWLGIKGFWAGVLQQADGLERHMVQFWGKRND